MIGSLGVFSLVAELSGAERNPDFFGSSKHEEDKEKNISFSLAHPLLVVVSFQICFHGVFTMRKTLKPWCFFSSGGFLEPTLSQIRPIKVNLRLQGQALSDCLIFLAHA